MSSFPSFFVLNTLIFSPFIWLSSNNFPSFLFSLFLPFWIFSFTSSFFPSFLLFDSLDFSSFFDFNVLAHFLSLILLVCLSFFFNFKCYVFFPYLYFSVRLFLVSYLIFFLSLILMPDFLLFFFDLNVFTFFPSLIYCLTYFPLFYRSGLLLLFLYFNALSFFLSLPVLTLSPSVSFFSF